MQIQFTLDKEAYKPTKAHATDAGFDLYAKEDQIIGMNNVIRTRRKTPSFSYGDIRRVLFTGIEPAQSTKLCKSPCKIIIFAI